MPLPFPFLDPNNPQVKALMTRNPNGVFASLIRNGQAKAGISGVPSGIVGGNNAGGVMPINTGSTQGGVGGTPSSFGGPSGYAVSAGTMGFGGRQMGMRTTYNSPNNFGQTGNNNGSMSGGSPVSFAAGGMMTEQGTAMRPGMPMPPSAGTGRTLPSARFKVDAQEPQLGAAPPAPLDSAQIEQEAQRFVQEHPEEAQKIQAVIALAIQTGELTSQELNMAVQLAKTALANPAAYPQIRQFAIKNGLGTEQDVPQEMDQGMLYVLIVAGKAAQAIGPTGSPKGNVPSGQGPAPAMENNMLPAYKDGGPTGDTAHLAKLHAREYVIPEDAVLFYGTDKFAKMIEKARNPSGGDDASGTN